VTGEPFSPSEEDRKALLGVYSSGQIQYPAVAVASGAAFLAELGLFLDPNFAAWFPHALFLALTAPTFLFTAIIANGYFLSTSAVVIVLRESVPTFQQIGKKLKDLNYPGLSDIDLKDGLGALDSYYSCLVRERSCWSIAGRKVRNPITRFMTKGSRVTLTTLAILFIALLLTFLASGV